MRRLLAAILFLCLATIASAQEAEFFAEAIYPIAGASYDVRSVDLDGANGPDLVATAQGGAGVSVLLNNGDGTVAQAVFYGVANGIRSVAVGDFDGNGTQDVVAAATVQSLFFLSGLGDGTLAEAVETAHEDWFGNAIELVGVHFDAGPTLDLVAITGGAMLVFAGDGDGTFGLPVVTQAFSSEYVYGGLEVEDLNDDGWPDVAYANGENVIFVALGDTEGGLVTPMQIPALVDAYDVTATDVDGDGDPDLVATGLGEIEVYPNDGAGGFGTGAVYDAGPSIGSSITAADLNLDGHEDVVVTQGSSGLYPLYGDGAGGYAAGSPIATSLGNHFGLLATDLNGDGKPDLVATDTGVTENELAVRLNATVPPTGPTAVDDYFETNEGQALNVPAPGVLENDSGTATLAAAKLTNPSGGEADILPDGSILYTPGPGFSGGDSFTYRLTDGNGLTDDATVFVTVHSLPPAVANDDSYETDVNEPLIVPAPGVLGNDDGTAPLAATIISYTTNGEVSLQPDGSFNYYPDTDYDGPDSFTYLLTDGNEKTSEATVQITVNPADPPPAAEPLFFPEGPEEPGIQPHVTRSRPVSVNLPYLVALAESEGGELVLNFFDGMDLLAYQERVEWLDQAHFNWYGRLYDYELDFVTIAVNLETSVISATATVNGHIFKVSSRSGAHVARDINQAEFPEGDDTSEEEVDTAGKAEPGPVDSPTTQNAVDSHSVIDILVIYTDDAAAAVDDIDVDIQEIIAKTNVGFVDSGIDAEVRAVHTMEWNYDEPESARKDRNRLQDPNDGHFDDVYALRDQYGADVVALLVEDGGDKLCGIAYIMKDNDGSYRDKAFFVTVLECATDGHTFAHELGHVMGARHDGFVDIGNQPFPYSHGWWDIGDRWRTMMSYNDACDCSDELVQTCPVKAFRLTKNEPVCQRLNRWSDPDAMWDNTTETDPGGAMGLADKADNVRALNNTAATVAAYSDAKFFQIDGTVTFQASGDPLEGIEISGFVDPVVTDTNGYFSRLVPIHWSGTVTPLNDSLSFHPPERSHVDVTSDWTIDFEAAERTVSGVVYVLDPFERLENVELQGFPEPVFTDSRGHYEVQVPDGWSDVVVPKLEPYRFDPPAIVIGPVYGPVEQDFEATGPPTVSGTIVDAQTKDPIEGAVLIGFPEDTWTDANGEYRATVDWGWTGQVVPLADGYLMDPEFRTYDGVYADITGADYEGAPAVLAGSEWPLNGRNLARTATGSGSPVQPSVRWEHYDFGRSPSEPVIGPGGLLYMQTSSGRLRLVDSAGNKHWLHTPSSSSGWRVGLAVGAGGRVFTTQRQNSGNGTVTAVLPDGSDNKWQRTYDSGISTAPALAASGMLYFGTEDGALVSLHASDGSDGWLLDLTDGELTTPALDADETVVVGSADGNVYAVSMDGVLEWTYTTQGPIESSPAIGSDGAVFIGSDDANVYALNPADGSLRWSYATGGPVKAPPALGPNGQVFVGSDDGYLYAIDGSGALSWKFDVGDMLRTRAVVSTHVSAFDPGQPGIRKTETVVYFGAPDGIVHAINAGGTFTPNVAGTERWSVDLGYDISWSPAMSYSGRTLYVPSVDRLFAIGGESSASGSGLVQLTSLGTYVDPEVLELKDNIHILIRLAEGGFGGDAILGGLPDDPCTGGPLFIPDCGDRLASGLGVATPEIDVAAGAEIRFGFVKEGTAPEVLNGNLNGLLGTYVSVLRDGTKYSGVLSGSTNPDLLALNPDGLPTKMSVFQAPTQAPAGSGTPVYVGHFSTDLPAVQMALRGLKTYEMGSLKYGEFSDVMLVEAGQYVAEIQVLDGIAGKSMAGGETLYLPVTVGEDGSGLEGILLSGFYRPDENLGGPQLATVQTDGEGIVEISALEQKTAARDIVVALLDETGKETLAEALRHLDASLLEDLWIDGRHLVPETGETVFDEDKDAIREIEKFIPGAGDEHAEVARLAIFHLVVADDVLATALIAEAGPSCSGRTCTRELDKARAAVDDARALLGDGEVQRSIRSYAHAWESAYEALVASGAAAKGDVAGAAGEVPADIALEANYPNPFNPVTVIGYALPEDAAVRLEIYDVLGRLVDTLVDGPMAAGRHEVSFDAGELAGGVYLYRLTAGAHQVTKTMTLLK